MYIVSSLLMPVKAFSSMPSAGRPSTGENACNNNGTEHANIKNNKPRFLGVTHNLRGRQWLSPEAFQRFLNISATPYVGKLPQPFLNLSRENPQQVFQALDELALILQGLRKVMIHDPSMPSPITSLQVTLGRSPKSVTVEHLGHGDYGVAYRLTVDGHAFAFKVYHDEETLGTHGNYGEIRTALYVSQKPLKDAARFRFGNPAAGWGMFELITPEMSSTSRNGKSLKDFKIFTNDGDGDNRINGILVDYGGSDKEGSNRNTAALKRPVVNISSLEEYRKAFATGDLSSQELAAAQIYRLPQEDREPAFKLAMASNVPTVQASAALHIWALPNNNAIKNAIQQAMKTNHPDVQTSVAANIVKLPQRLKEKVLQRVMETNHPGAQARAVSSILSMPNDWFPDGLQEKVFLLAMHTRHLEVQVVALRYLNKLSDAIRKKGFQLALATDEPPVQAKAASKIYVLPKTFTETAFKLALQTQHPTVLSEAALQISSLPADFEEEAVKLYLDAINSGQAFKQVTITRL